MAQKTEMDAVRLNEPGSAIYDKSTEDLPKRNVCLATFRQSFKYFEHVEDQLRVDLTFKRSIRATARRWLEKVRAAICYFLAGHTASTSTR